MSSSESGAAAGVSDGGGTARRAGDSHSLSQEGNKELAGLDDMSPVAVAGTSDREK